jgi:uncharacterized repeat protein (TIGR03803 family)
MQASDGNFYGTAKRGGLSDNGTVFMMTPAGSVRPIYSFGATDSLGRNTGGARPVCGLLEGNDGFLYGTTNVGGQFGLGTIFRVPLFGQAGNFALHSGEYNGLLV